MSCGIQIQPNFLSLGKATYYFSSTCLRSIDPVLPMAQVTEQQPAIDNEAPPAANVPAFLGLTQQQSALLVALYNETDPEFAKQIPTALPVAAQQLAAEYEKRNSVGKKVYIF